MRLNAFGFVQEIFKDFKEGRTDRALERCTGRGASPLAAVFRIGMARATFPPDRLEKILEQAGNNQIVRMEKHLGALVAVISVEPLLGFLGTITGLIRAFMSWEQAGAEVTVSVLAQGMYQAMITTAAGLIVAIPLYLCYTYFVSRIKYLSNALTNQCFQLVEVMAEARHGVRP
jgi:biopolymer transport protein ExbB